MYCRTILITILALLFSGCTKPFTALKLENSSGSQTQTPATESYERGVSLYKTKNCANCHGTAVENSTKKGTTLERLEWAISGNVQVMNNIRLNEVEKKSLVLALNKGAEGTILKLPIQRTGRMMGRRYIASVLREIFQSANFTTLNFDSMIAGVTHSPGTFGTPCNIYSSYSGDDCGGEISSNSSSPLFTNSTVVRQLKQVEVCEQLTSNSLTLQAAIENAGGIGSQQQILPVTESAIVMVVKLFEPDRVVEKPEVQIYLDLQKKLTQVSDRTLDHWRLVIQLACENPRWTIN